MIKIDVSVGDTVLVGRFKNKPVKVKKIGEDEHGMPTINNGRKCCTFRIKKKEQSKENSMKLKSLLEKTPPKYDHVSKQVLKNRLYKYVNPLTKKIYKDEYWRGPKYVWKVFNNLDLNWGIKKSEYGYHKNYPGANKDHRNRMPDYKVWQFEIEFTNNRGKNDKIIGTLTAHGAGSVDDPLEKYDITVVLS